jgi:hypothetical protein
VAFKLYHGPTRAEDGVTLNERLLLYLTQRHLQQGVGSGAGLATGFNPV